MQERFNNPQVGPNLLTEVPWHNLLIKPGQKVVITDRISATAIANLIGLMS